MEFAAGSRAALACFAEDGWIRKFSVDIFLPSGCIEAIERASIEAYPNEIFIFLLGQGNRVESWVIPPQQSGYDFCEPDPQSLPDDNSIVATVHSHLDDKYFAVPSVEDFIEENWKEKIHGIVAVWKENGGELQARTFFWPPTSPFRVIEF